MNQIPYLLINYLIIIKKFFEGLQKLFNVNDVGTNFVLLNNIYRYHVKNLSKYRLK